MGTRLFWGGRGFLHFQAFEIFKETLNWQSIQNQGWWNLQVLNSQKKEKIFCLKPTSNLESWLENPGNRLQIHFLDGILVACVSCLPSLVNSHCLQCSPLVFAPDWAGNWFEANSAWTIISTNSHEEHPVGRPLRCFQSPEKFSPPSSTSSLNRLWNSKLHNGQRETCSWRLLVFWYKLIYSRNVKANHHSKVTNTEVLCLNHSIFYVFFSFMKAPQQSYTSHLLRNWWSNLEIPNVGGGSISSVRLMPCIYLWEQNDRLSRGYSCSRTDQLLTKHRKGQSWERSTSCLWEAAICSANSLDIFTISLPKSRAKHIFWLVSLQTGAQKNKAALSALEPSGLSMLKSSGVSCPWQQQRQWKRPPRRQCDLHRPLRFQPPDLKKAHCGTVFCIQNR